jgi:hypothetical protein
MKCGKCGAENPPEYEFCGGCGAPFQEPLAQEQNNDSYDPSAQPTPPTTRESATKWFNYVISEYARRGYRLVFRYSTTAKLVRPKKVSRFGICMTLLCWLLICVGLLAAVLVGQGLLSPSWTGLFVVGLICGSPGVVFPVLTVFDYLLSKDRTVFLSLDETGKVNTTVK